uniref:Transthyretin-like family protein n=1 Tax=Panagrellus redivivus TaxID=6233 RepID=A0A7E4V612_PANRE
MQSITLFLFVYFIATSVASIVPEQHSGVQSYRVVGVLKCGDKPANGVRVKLVDDDFGPDPDDDLDVGYTDENGHFDLSGDTTELTTIDPHLKVYHDCNDGFTPCQRRWKFELPNSYITSARTPAKTLDIGVWNLEAKMPDESHDCVH